MTGFVPGLANDVFISYAHEDDGRWVHAFAEALRDEVSRRLGLGVAIWEDKNRLRVGDNWNDAIHEVLKQSAAFVAIVSPRYQNSQWCARERQLFRDHLGSDAELEKSGRLFKIVKTPWPNNGHRFFYGNIQDVEFFKEDDEDGRREFTAGSREFKRAVQKIADGLELLLRRMRRGSQRVHVAWPVEECLHAWEQLSDELRTQGFDVQPTGPRDTSFGEGLIREDLDRAVLSIHLLGAAYDQFSERVVTLAADLNQRLIFWFAAGAETTVDERQRLLLDAIRRGLRPDQTHKELPAGWSLLPDKGPRRLIDDVLTQLRPQAVPTPLPAATTTPSVYIVHDATTAEDTQVALTLKEQIHQREHMEIFVSRTDLSSLTELKLRHENLLRSCDGVLLFRNAAPEGWWNQLAPEVLLAERRFERHPINSRAFLLPKAPEWEVGPDVKVIPYTSPFPFSDLEPFLEPLRR
jgi:TIR domain-containing protein